MPTTKRRALILISSARQLPLVEPADVKSISTGFFLVEMAQVLKEFEDDYAFTFADLDFIHAPGGHAPMVDFRDDPWLGETLHLARENRVTTSLICHAPLAVTSTRQRIDAQGAAYSVKDNPFLAATISVVPKVGERIALRFLYPLVPGKRTRLPYFVDVAIKEAGFTVTSPLTTSAP